MRGGGEKEHERAEREREMMDERRETYTEIEEQYGSGERNSNKMGSSAKTERRREAEDREGEETRRHRGREG